MSSQEQKTKLKELSFAKEPSLRKEPKGERFGDGRGIPRNGYYKPRRKKQDSFFDVSPSSIGADYLYVIFTCACCRRKFGRADYRKTDVEDMIAHGKPLCPNCAKYVKSLLEKVKVK
jgi:hypothetical protein